MPGMTEWLIILAIVLVLFGAKKIPELAKGLGTGIKDFKKAMSEEEEEAQKQEEAKKVSGESQTEQKPEEKQTT